MKTVSKKVKTIVAGMGLMLTLPVFAGNEGGQEGHGGRVYFCKDASGTEKVELLDYYLGRSRWLMNIETQTGADEYEIISKTLATLRKLDQDRANVYEARAKKFIERSIFVDESEFPDAGDVNGPVGKREGCELKQIVHQIMDQHPLLPKGKKFLVSKENWSRLDATMKAGIILHEIILEDASFIGANSSADGGMYFNALITSREFATVDVDLYVEALKKAGLEMFYRGTLALDSITYDNKIKDKLVIISATIHDAPLTLYPESNIIPVNKQPALVSGKVAFYPTGEIAYVTNAHSVSLFGTKAQMLKDVTLYKDTMLLTAKLTSDVIYQATNALVGMTANTSILFSEAGIPQALKGLKPDYWRGGGSTITIRTSEALFNADPEVGVSISPSGHVRAFKMYDVYEVSIKAGKFKATGNTVLNDAGELVATTMTGRPRWMKTEDGTREWLNFDNKTPVVIVNGGAKVANGIFNPNDLTRFIRIVTEGKKVGFRDCKIESIDSCEQIGARPFYTRRELRRNLDLSLRVSTENSLEKFVAFPAAGVSGLGVFVAAMASTIAGGAADAIVVVMLIPSAAVGAMAGIVVYGGVMVGNWIANLPGVQERRAIRHIIRKHYVFTEVSIAKVRQEIEASLAELK